MFRFQLESQKLSSRCTCKKHWNDGLGDVNLWFFIYFWSAWWPEREMGPRKISGKIPDWWEIFFPPNFFHMEPEVMMGFQVRNLRISRDFGLQVNHVKFQGCRHHLARKKVQLQRIAEPHCLSPFPAKLAGWTNEKKPWLFRLYRWLYYPIIWGFW